MSSRKKFNKPKKTVSFSDLPALKNESLKSSGTGNGASQLDQLVQFSNVFTIIPYHYLTVISAAFKKYDITSDPTTVLTKLLVLTLVLQLAYAYVIQMSTVVVHGKKKHLLHHTKVNFLYISASLVISLSSSVVLFVILILFGAPFLSLSLETYLLACHLSLIVVFPLLISFNFADSPNFKLYWEKLIAQFNFSNQMYCICAGTVIGTWLGCFPIPLDWDRAWQRWPITLFVGGYLGGFVGGCLSGLALLLEPLVIG